MSITEKAVDRTGEGTRGRILRVATTLFASRGFDGVSVREIVRLAGVNLGAVTYHFGGKQELFAEVLNEKLGLMKRLARGILESDVSPAEKLRELLRAYARHVLCTDPGLRVLFVAMLHQGSDAPAVVHESLAWRNEVFAATYQAGVKAGELREGDVTEAAWFFFGMLTPYLLYKPLGGDGQWEEQKALALADRAFDFFFQGIAAPGRRSPQWARRNHD